MKLISWSKDRISELVQLWNKEIGQYFPMREELFGQNSFADTNVCYEASQIAVNAENKTIGFIVAKKWQDEIEVGLPANTGWIQVLLVHHNYRHQGVGKALLAHTENTFKQSGVTRIILGQDVWHYFPGIPSVLPQTSAWFEHQGYQANGKAFDLLSSYTALSYPKPNKPGVELSLLKKEEKSSLLTFLNRCFPGRWEYEAIQYFKHGGTGREFVVLKKNQHIIGFCRINDASSPIIAQNVYWSPLFNEALGGIGPLGVDEQERGNGYGKMVVQAGIHYLRERGINRIVIDWTGLVNFYKQLDYGVWKSYWYYVKDLVK
ncbi:MAG: GNAT family N-acetyltransferase [Bacillota bacterium]|uniref:GNAT family N-acetyltransferase n=1 Tax=Virgibacillus salarius TaxID=447199 RepID=A0A941DUS6_9BACI|nr:MULTISPECIES: GNAT family N-acetyltransferase [Bacillaceae]MBR7795877.1 GNAT family N-acetyltransferase [Virgibacillus salarius]MDY7042805.1 GNAT family N-acetyltransferase [Virgibacillus sp. M23]NAZ08589.1 GNAT family N-acetyltransferase [Agaribacter marinus]